MDEALLKRVAAGTASAEERTKARALLRSDPAAQRAYRVLVEAERALSGRPVDEPSPIELERILPNVLDAVSSSSSQAHEPKRASAARWLYAVAPLVAAAAIVFLVVRPKTSDDEFSARGGPEAPPAFSLFCVANGGNGPAHEMLGAEPHCARGSSLVVALPSSDANASVTHIELVDAAKSANVVALARPILVPADGVLPQSVPLARTTSIGRASVIVDLERMGAREQRTRAFIVDEAP